MTSEHVDVVVIGAGLSGVNAAAHLLRSCPQKSVAVLEAREAMGGTWDLFRFPGVRSDSDMFTLGYGIRPWDDDKAFADGPAIKRYIEATASEHGVRERIRFGHKVVAAEWSTPDASWHLEVDRDDGERVTISCDFVFACTGYYRYDRGYWPEFDGAGEFEGRIVHPQEWPADLDYADKDVVVVGSGATAVTLVPALAEHARRVTMLQRSPSYVASLPASDPLAGLIRRIAPGRIGTALMRAKNAATQLLIFGASRRFPGLVKTLLRRSARRRLPAGYDVDRHFSPDYNPWDQRLCIAPDGDFFEAIREGRASVVTDEIEAFTPDGLKLRSGSSLEADLVVMATGLNVQLVGGIDLVVDGREVALSETVTYKGAMLSGVPNLAVSLGYTNQSWTLKCELISEYVCRLINHMDANGQRVCLPRGPGRDAPTTPLIDLSSGYVQRAIDFAPRQGEAAPWRLSQNWFRDRRRLRREAIEDGVLELSRG